MAKWFYYDENNTKIETDGIGLKRLALAGVITPDTVVETESGTQSTAGNVKGLEFEPPPFIH